MNTTKKMLKNAIQNNEITQVALAIQGGANPNKQLKHDNGSLYFPLEMALTHGCSEIALLLIDLGASVHARSAYHNMPLINIAALKGDEAVLKKMISMGASVNEIDENGMTALMVSCYYDQLEAVKILLESGASLHITCDDGTSVLDIAIHKGYPPMIDLFLHKMIEIDLAS